MHLNLKMVLLVMTETNKQKLQSELQGITVYGETPVGTYYTIVIDPPWPINWIEGDRIAERPNQVALEYPTMTHIETFSRMPREM